MFLRATLVFLISLFLPSSSSLVSSSVAQQIESSGFRSRSNATDGSASIRALYPVILPYRFVVPNTETVLFLGFGLRRRALSAAFIESLIVVSKDYIAQQIDEQGAHTFNPITPNIGQLFYKSLGDGISLEIQSVLPDRFFDWDTVQDVVEDLSLYSISGWRVWQCYFNFHNAEGIIGTGQLAREEPSDIF